MFAEKLELVDDSEHEAQQNEILEQIEAAIKKEEIRLPAMPDLVMKIRASFKDEQYDIINIARIIQSEAGLAAYILKIANSPLHRGPMPIKTAKHAICRLGQHSVQNIVLTYTVRSLFETENTTLNALLQNQWQMSTNIGAISAILAERCEDFDPDRAMLGGLLQDIGALPLLDWLKNNHLPKDDLVEEFHTLRANHAAKIGEIILRSWEFDPELIEVVRSREDWQRNSGDAVDTADIVTIARHHYYMGSGLGCDCPKLTDVPAYHKLAFKELSPDDSLVILEEAKEDIEELHNMLV